MDEIYVVSTEFVSMLTQRPAVRRCCRWRSRRRRASGPAARCRLRVRAATDSVLDALLPHYIASRIFNAMLESAASELGGPAARDEVRHRQRERAHRPADPGGEQGPAGRDHPGNQRNRRRRRTRSLMRPQEVSKQTMTATVENAETSGTARHRPRRPGHRPGRRRGVPGRRDAGDLQRAARRHRRSASDDQDADPRGRAAHRRQHGPRHRPAADRRPGPRRRGHRHRRADHGAGRRRDQGPRVQRARRGAGRADRVARRHGALADPPAAAAARPARVQDRDVRHRHQGHRPADPVRGAAARSACSAAPASARRCSSRR